MRKLNGITINGEYLGNSVVINGMFRAICTISPVIMRDFVRIINKIEILEDAVKISNFNCDNERNSIDIEFENNESSGIASLYFKLHNGEPILTDCELMFDDYEFSTFDMEEEEASDVSDTGISEAANSGSGMVVGSGNTSIQNVADSDNSSVIGESGGDSCMNSVGAKTTSSTDNQTTPEELTKKPDKRERFKSLKEKRARQERLHSNDSNKKNPLKDLFKSKADLIADLNSERKTDSASELQNSDAKNDIDNNSGDKALDSDVLAKENNDENGVLDANGDVTGAGSDAGSGSELTDSESDDAYNENEFGYDTEDDDYYELHPDENDNTKVKSFTIYADTIKIEVAGSENLGALQNSNSQMNGQNSDNFGSGYGDFGSDFNNNFAGDNTNGQGGFDFSSNGDNSGFDINSGFGDNSGNANFAGNGQGFSNNGTVVAGEPNYEKINSLNNDATMQARETYSYDANSNPDDISDIYSDFYGSQSNSSANAGNGVSGTTSNDNSVAVNPEYEALKAELDSIKQQTQTKKLMTLEEFLAKQKELAEAQEKKRRQKFRIVGSKERINASALDGGVFVAGNKVYKWGSTRYLDG